jgi:hypothetical protein
MSALWHELNRLGWSHLQRLMRGDDCPLPWLYTAIAVGFAIALIAMLATSNALAGVVGGSLAYIVVVIWASPARHAKKS